MEGHGNPGGPYGEYTNMAESQIPSLDSDTPTKPYFEEEASSIHWQIIKQAFPLVVQIMSNIITGFLLYLIISWNFGNIGMHQYSTPHALRSPLFITQLDQYPYGTISPRFHL